MFCEHGGWGVVGGCLEVLWLKGGDRVKGDRRTLLVCYFEMEGVREEGVDAWVERDPPGGGFEGWAGTKEDKNMPHGDSEGAAGESGPETMVGSAASRGKVVAGATVRLSTSWVHGRCATGTTWVANRC